LCERFPLFVFEERATPLRCLASLRCACVARPAVRCSGVLYNFWEAREYPFIAASRGHRTRSRYFFWEALRPKRLQQRFHLPPPPSYGHWVAAQGAARRAFAVHLAVALAVLPTRGYVWHPLMCREDNLYRAVFSGAVFREHVPSLPLCALHERDYGAPLPADVVWGAVVF